MSNNGNSSYKVDVNPDVAFTINYEDEQGRMLFSIEVDDTPKKIFLNPRPSMNGSLVDTTDAVLNARVVLAVQRVKAYFTNRGLAVELD